MIYSLGSAARNSLASAFRGWNARTLPHLSFCGNGFACAGLSQTAKN